MSDEVMTEPKSDDIDETDAAADPAPVSEAEDVAAVEMVEAVEQTSDLTEASAAIEDSERWDPSEAPAAGELVTDAVVLNEQQPSAELRAIVEALVFASPDPITPKTLYRLLSDEPKEDVSAALNALMAEYASRPGLQMVQVAGGYQIVTRPELREWVRRLFHERSTQKLTAPGLESLAVIAYRQPITALEITEIRGVNTSGVLTTLLERHLIKIVGRKNVVGRPFLYATTKEFLIRFGLKDLADLPRIEDMAEALGFDPPAGLVEQTPREEILPLEEDEAGKSVE